MPLVSMTQLMSDALAGGYGLGYFEAWDAYSLEAVCDAAEREKSPVILGFGGMMANPEWLDRGGVETLGALGRSRAARLIQPTALLFNEAQTREQVDRAMDSGFTAVMLDTSTWPSAQAIPVVAEIVRAAHPRGIAVEAELGCLPNATEGGIDVEGSALTQPEDAAAFVQATGVDCLAVSIGNVHLLTAPAAPVDLDRLGRIHEATPVPLVIHGGTSFPTELVAEAVKRGAGKFNVGTTLKRAFWTAVRDEVRRLEEPLDVHRLMGSHFAEDLLEAGKQAMTLRVQELMRAYGSSGRGRVSE